MYMPKHHEETDVGVLYALIGAHPLGTWVTQGDGELVANHIPFLLDPTRGPLGTLVAHVARANPVWRSFSAAVPSLIAFQGAECYITPSWYASKRAHGKTVPTWNYAVVHAHGLPRAIEDADWLLRHVTALTRTHEAKRDAPWQVTDAPGISSPRCSRPSSASRFRSRVSPQVESEPEPSVGGQGGRRRRTDRARRRGFARDGGARRALCKRGRRVLTRSLR
jgi:predicted FMN-binding regulatory protein PaiB